MITNHRTDYLTCPLEELPPEHLEPLQPVPEFITRLRSINHEQFMQDRNQAGWLSWQLSRPLPLPTKTPTINKDNNQPTKTPTTNKTKSSPSRTKRSPNAKKKK